jgi:hypothetical protein
MKVKIRIFAWNRVLKSNNNSLVKRFWIWVVSKV